MVPHLRHYLPVREHSANTPGGRIARWARSESSRKPRAGAQLLRRVRLAAVSTSMAQIFACCSVHLLGRCGLSRCIPCRHTLDHGRQRETMDDLHLRSRGADRRD
jgi:hypothetical protein